MLDGVGVQIAYLATVSLSWCQSFLWLQGLEDRAESDTLQVHHGAPTVIGLEINKAWIAATLYKLS